MASTGGGSSRRPTRGGHSPDSSYSHEDLSESYVDIATYSPFTHSYSPLAGNGTASMTGPSHHMAATMTPSPTSPLSQASITTPDQLPDDDENDPPAGLLSSSEQRSAVTDHLLPPATSPQLPQDTSSHDHDANAAAVPAAAVTSGPAEPEKSQKRVSEPRTARFVEMFKGTSPSPSRHMDLDLGPDTAYRGAAGQVPPTMNHFEHDNDDDHEELIRRFNQGPPLDCHSKKDVHVRRRSSLFIIQIILSVYSTVLSGIWLVVALYQPRYGRGVSSSSHSSVMLSPSTASVLSTLFSKTIEMSFVTVFVACLGQILSRRAFVKQANGVTLSEMTMRNWVVQPGSLFTYWQGIPRAGTTLAGALALIATLSALFYTTAADAMVSPKLRFGDWYPRELQGLVNASYSNPIFVRDSCPTPIDDRLDPQYDGASCLDIKYSGQSYHNLLTFMTDWQRIHDGGDQQKAATLKTRPNGKHSLFDNTTMVSSWIETEYGDPAASFDKYKRIVNNVTLSMPHPGVYQAATDPINGILQPIELSGVGEYSIKAAVVSPTVNIMCVNMKKSELEPLVYTAWPNPRQEKTDIIDQTRGVEDWSNDVPPPSDNEWLNQTVVDDIFRWGADHKRRPPVFQMYPYDYNMITNTTVVASDAIYLLAKSAQIEDYTVCEMRSWTSPKCSTHFDISGTSGGSMKAHCEDPDDENSYLPQAKGVQPATSVDWKNMVDQWRLSMDLNGGISTSNASTSRIMTNFILTQPALDPLLPSMAEAMAALSSSTLIGGSLQSTFKHYWDYPEMILSPGQYETFSIVIQEQQYTSSYESDWQKVFYIVLVLVFVINVICFLYLVFRRGMVTDFTEPQNMFALAINSPPSRMLQGSCGGGPDREQLRKPWRISYSEAANHYYFQETRMPSVHTVVDKLGEYSHPHHDGGRSSGSESLLHPEGRYRNSYKRLTTSKIGRWL